MAVDREMNLSHRMCGARRLRGTWSRRYIERGEHFQDQIRWIIANSCRGTYELYVKGDGHFISYENATALQHRVPDQAEVLTADLCGC